MAEKLKTSCMRHLYQLMYLAPIVLIVGYFYEPHFSSYCCLVLGVLYIPIMEYFGRANKDISINKQSDQGTTIKVVFGSLWIAFSPLFARFLTDVGKVDLGDQIRWLCVLTLLLGYSIRYWAMKTLGIYFTATLRISEKQTVINTGPYKVVRHPGYLANLVIGLAYSLGFTQNIILFFLTFAIFWYCWMNRIDHEENMMINTFGNAYKQYQKQTWRLIPYVY